MQTIDHVSYSQLVEWMTCRYRWYLKYGRRLMPRARERAPDIGSAVHQGLESLLLGGSIRDGVQEWANDAIGTLAPSDDQQMRLDVADAVAPIAREAEIIATRGVGFLDLSRWETVHIDGKPAVEIDISINLPGIGVPLVGKIDWIAKDIETGYIWIFEHKTRETLTTDAYEEVDLQKAIYQYILAAEYGLECSGAMTFEMRSQAPSIPTLNKDGSMSKQRIVTDWPTYREELLRNGLNPADYEEMEGKLDDVRWNLLRPSFRSLAECSAVWNQVAVPLSFEIVEAANRMQVEKEPFFQRSMMPWNCRRCPFRDLCLAAMKDWDTEGIEREQFISLEAVTA